MTDCRRFRPRCLASAAAVWVCLWAVAGSATAGLQNDVQQILTGASIGDTRASVLVVDLRTGRTLVDVEADAPMVPASNMKLLTTAAALTRLGPDFKFSTRLLLLPKPTAETASGPPPGGKSGADSRATSGGGGRPPSLLVRGTGDPAFGDPGLLASAGLYLDDLIDLWVTAVKDTGQTRFETLFIDDRVFDRVFVHPSWPKGQLHRYSYAQVAGVNFYENLLAVLPVPAENFGQAPTVQVEPYFSNLRTTNRATTGDADLFDIQRNPGGNRFIFTGSVRNRRSQPFRATVHDPPMFFAAFFQYKLKQAGIRVGRVARVDPQARGLPDGAAVLHEINTTLAGVLDRTNADSQNLFAEALFKRMGHDLTGAPGSFQNGASAIRLFLRDRLADHVGLSAVRVTDGSGLSPDNRLSAAVIVSLLRRMHADATLGPIYAASLSHAGHTGTLRLRLRDLSSEVYGKSGYLGASADYASALSGYLVRPDGRTYAFSLVFNQFRPPVSHDRIKQVQDQILQAIDASIAAPAR
ncbi:MAG: D-alanyl-D-alanine carboxypeptidase/D-alanyl-D-alanine-endopeptidase [Planctomycetota bacterium]